MLLFFSLSLCHLFLFCNSKSLRFIFIGVVVILWTLHLKVTNEHCKIILSALFPFNKRTEQKNHFSNAWLTCYWDKRWFVLFYLIWFVLVVSREDDFQFLCGVINRSTQQNIDKTPVCMICSCCCSNWAVVKFQHWWNTNIYIIIWISLLKPNICTHTHSIYLFRNKKVRPAECQVIDWSDQEHSTNWMIKIVAWNMNTGYNEYS